MARKQLSWLTGATLVLLVGSRTVFAFSTGITGLTTSSTGCNQCHSGGQVPAVTLSGPTNVAPGSTNEYTLEITPVGTQIWGGLDAGASGGTLSVGGSNSASTQLLSGEITHTQRKGGDGNPIRFSFLWTAPAVGGVFTLRAWGNAVNGNGANSGDRAAFASLSVNAGPTATPTVTATATASPTPTPPAHDALVQPLAPRTIKIPKTAPVGVTKKFALKVRNADPSGVPAQTIALSLLSTTCPSGVTFTAPDFDGKTAGEQSQILLNPGQGKAAVVSVSVSHADISSLLPTLPFRCSATYRADVVLSGNTDPSPNNNEFPLELNFIDLADAAQPAPDEAWLKRAPHARANIPSGVLTQTVRRTIQVANADTVPHTLGLAVDASACPWVSVLSIDFDPKTPSIEPNLLVAPGKTGKALVQLVADGSMISTSNSRAPQRCVLTATVQGPASPDPEPSNDSSKFVLDVIDKNDL